MSFVFANQLSWYFVEPFGSLLHVSSGYRVIFTLASRLHDQRLGSV